jgi:hypothetical protein
MFRFGHMSEWWWRLTQFAPGQPPLLPLDVRRKSQASGATFPDPNSSAVVQNATYDEEKLAAMVSASVATAIRSLRNEMDGIIKTSVASGVAEALARQNSSTGSLTRQSSATLVGTETPMDIDDSFDGGPASHSIPPSNTEPMDIDGGVGSQRAHHYLKLFYKDKAHPKFRSTGQQKMVEMAFEGTQNFVGVLPTGGGKSLVFLLPAFAATVDTPEHGLVEKTLVVIPNKSLMDDTLRKAIKAGVSCNQWTVSTSERVIKDTALILIAIESLASFKFKL